jgi:hypothetical protein
MVSKQWLYVRTFDFTLNLYFSKIFYVLNPFIGGGGGGGGGEGGGLRILIK